jgi:TP901 family phage tail tape measure protein
MNIPINIWLNQQGIENNLKSVRAAIIKTTNELAKLPYQSEEWYQKSKKLSELKSIYSEMQQGIKATSEEIEKAGEHTKNLAMAWGGAAAVFQTASSAVRRFVSATQEYVDAYARMDDAMTNVSKYTGLTREEVKQLNEEFRKMDTRTPTEKLNALAADAGRLGITSKEAIKDFVEAADIINVALGEDLGEDAVKEIGKMATMFGESDRLGLRGAMIATASAVNTLAQSSSASEPYIMDFSARLSGIANTAGITQAQIMGIASAMDQNMAQVEKSATAVQKVMMDMMSKTEKYANLVGMTTEEFRKLVDNDMNTAFLTVIDTFNKINESGPSALGETLADLKLKGAGVQETLLTLASHTDQLREAQALATQAYADGNSVINEAAAVNGNAAAQLEKAKKKMQDMKAELGNKLIPTITKLADVGAGGLKLLSSIITWAGQHKVLVSAMIALTLKYYATKHKEFLLEVKRQALEKAGIILSKAKNAILATSTTFTQLFALAQAKLTKNTLAAANAQKALKAAFAATPWSLIITAILALVDVFERLAKATFTTEGRTAAFYKKYRDEAEITYKKEEDRINALVGIIESETTSRDKKLEAIKKLQEVMPDYKADLDEEGRLLSHNKEKIDEYLTSFRKMATLKGAQAAYENAEKEYQTKKSEWDAQREIYQNSNWVGKGWRLGKRWLLDLGGEYIGRQFFGLDFGPGMADVQAHDAKEVRDRLLKQYEDLAKEYQKEYQKLLLEDEDPKPDPKNNPNNSAAELEKRKQEFREKLADYYQSIRDANLDEFSKLRKEILKKNAELYKEMNDLGMGDELLPTLNAARDEAFKKMTHDLVAKYQKASLDVMDAIRKTVGKDYSNKIEEELDKDNKKWYDAEKKVWDNLNSLSDIYNHLSETLADPEELKEVDEAIKVQEALLKEIEKRKIESQANIIKKNYEEILKFAQEKDNEQRRAAELAGKTEKEQAELRKQWRIQEIQEEYDIRIRLAEAELEAKEALNDGDEEGLRKIRDLITELKRLKKEVPNMIDNEGKSKQTPKDEGLLSLFNISSMDPWEENLKRAVNALEELRATAMDVFNSMVEMQQNAAEQELNRFTEAQDAKSRKLQQQLEEGLISQKYYDAQMEKMEAEREKKEKQIRHDEWDREHQASLVNAIAAGALAASNSLANGGGVPWGLIPMGVSLITTGANIALIASQVNPYAKGGYIRKKQLALVGEKGPEWVASNTLLEDNETAPVIAALEDYQRGNRSPLRMVAPTQPAWKNLSQSASQISSTFASNRTPVVHHHYQTVGGDELLKEVKQMNQFLSDPKNRQAYISYKIQTEAQKNRDFIKQAAKL